MTYVLAQLAPLGALALAFGIGGWALERFAADDGTDATPPELRALRRAVLGVVLFMALLFALAAAGCLGAGGVAAAGGLCIAAAIAARVRRGPSRAPATPRGGAFLAAALLLTLPLWLLALSWEVSWDAAAYHLTLPKHWLASGGFDSIPGLVYGYWPLATELLYAAALAIGDHPVAKLLHGGFGLATLWAAWLSARLFHREAGAWIAAPLVLASPVVLFEWSVAYVDLCSAFFFLAGVVFVARWRASEGRDRASLWHAGICGGALAAVKVNGVLGAAALFVALAPLLVARARGGGARAALADAARFALPVVLLWMPWLARSAVLTGNPFYPLWFDAFGGPDWSPRLSEQLLDWQRSIGMGRGALDFVLLPWRVAVEGGPGYDRFGAAIGAHWVAVVPLAAFAHRNPLVRTALLASAAWFVLWALGSQQARFLVPILAPLALCGAIGALSAAERLGDARARRLGAVLLGGMALALALAALRGPAERARALLPRIAEGRDALRADAVLPVHRFVTTLPEDAKLLLLNTNQGYFLERDYEADSFFEASQIAERLRGIASAAEVRERLADRGITHVLRAGYAWGIPWPDALLAMLRDEQLARRRFRAPDGAYEVFELVGGGAR